jgi:hypothetical protein
LKQSEMGSSRESRHAEWGGRSTWTAKDKKNTSHARTVKGAVEMVLRACG